MVRAAGRRGSRPGLPGDGRRSERYCVSVVCGPHLAGSADGQGRGWPMRRRFGVMFVRVLALAAVMIAAMAPASPASTAAGPASSAGRPGEGVPAFGHVFLIIGENTTYSHVTASNAPF